MAPVARGRHDPPGSQNENQIERTAALAIKSRFIANQWKPCIKLILRCSISRETPWTRNRAPLHYAPVCHTSTLSAVPEGCVEQNVDNYVIQLVFIWLGQFTVAVPAESGCRLSGSQSRLSELIPFDPECVHDGRRTMNWILEPARVGRMSLSGFACGHE